MRRFVLLTIPPLLLACPPVLDSNGDTPGDGSGPLSDVDHSGTILWGDEPLADAPVTIGEEETRTDAAGRYALSLPAGVDEPLHVRLPNDGEGRARFRSEMGCAPVRDGDYFRSTTFDQDALGSVRVLLDGASLDELDTLGVRVRVDYEGGAWSWTLGAWEAEETESGIAFESEIRRSGSLSVTVDRVGPGGIEAWGVEDDYDTPTGGDVLEIPISLEEHETETLIFDPANLGGAESIRVDAEDPWVGGHVVYSGALPDGPVELRVPPGQTGYAIRLDGIDGRCASSSASEFRIEPANGRLVPRAPLETGPLASGAPSGGWSTRPAVSWEQIAEPGTVSVSAHASNGPRLMDWSFTADTCREGALWPSGHPS